MPQTSALKPLRIVIADDNRDAAETLALLLTLDGHQVCVAYNGAHALDAIRRMHPQVTVLDIGMPELDGYQVAERVRRDSDAAGTVLVALTAWGRPQDRARAHAAGFDHYLVKPADPNAMRALIQAVRPESTR